MPTSGQLAPIIAILARAEVYDLVRVDSISDRMEQVKKEIAAKAKVLLLEKVKNYEGLIGAPFSPASKRLAEGYRVFLPAEMYNSYQASSNSVLNATKSGNVNRVPKTSTLYYQPVLDDKEFDFVVNPVILEPVIQVLYEVRLMVQNELGNGKSLRLRAK